MLFLRNLGKNNNCLIISFWELIELIEEPICQKLYLGDYGLYVAWGKDES